MKEPILSREEVGSIWTDLSGRPFVEGSLADAFAKRIESAMREKLCGEPVAWRAPNLSGSGDAWAYRDADDRFEDQHGEPVGEPLYALNRSKA